MNRKYRKTLIAGNWKMNKTPFDARELLEAIRDGVSKVRFCDIAVCPPFVTIPLAARVFRECRITVGAQNLNAVDSGAYTGEISAPMLKSAGCKYVIVGHSERRQYYGETNEIVRDKILAALKAGLRPIVCVGESLAERESGLTLDLITLQVKAAVGGLSADRLKECVFAYEPIWAIGTGKTATAEQANEVCAHIRNVLRELHNARVSRSITIQYGGSMNAANAAELLAQPDIDGGLIGGASLKAADFAAIVNAANQG